MLNFEMQGRVLHVQETIHGWVHTKVSHWYYDLDKWTKSSHGRLGDKPDRPMTHDDIAWVQKHYLPKVGVQA